ncbi:AAA family ATPase [Chitinophagaceae bacterium LB-8]|uniref:AAA family ATPase n=1 Tax=Paraflavisolibacter caeni TaxID=2982496 RepID=A0A9X2XPB0_9BACT|nr:AAA family ATPase [Paraflavisolibacter caeni]MCU7550424.1 AAA family ATPase [Paraflavisolibacter caeni]
MFLSKLLLWNFRRYGATAPFDLSQPHLALSFNKGINLLIGENDSGKTAIIDSIKLLLKTHSGEWVRIEHEDFFKDSIRLRIECKFEDLSEDEAQNFTEWLGWETLGGQSKPYLKVFLDVSRSDKKIIPADIRAGADHEGYILTAEARDKLRVTYLRPLRDATNELSSKKNSRLSQILFSHEAFSDKEGHRFIELAATLNNEIAAYFKGEEANGAPLPPDQQQGKGLKQVIDKYLKQFANRETDFRMTDTDLKSVLESLCLLFKDGYNLGLGSHNLLCIASELLHLQKTNWDGLRLGLVEEIEAHLHPQVQLQVIETLDNEAPDVQLIFTTHSPNIGSKIPLKNLIICQQGKTFPMGEEHTQLKPTDYTFLERFLDVTKANMFFARGVILVEGWAEEIILPVIAKKNGHNLTAKGVSIVNIANTAFLRYAKVFQRKNGISMHYKVAVITDVDVKPLKAGDGRKVEKADGTGKEIVPYTAHEIDNLILTQQQNKQAKYNGQVVITFVSPFWTLEYCLARSVKLRKLFYKSVLEALLEQKEEEEVSDLTAYRSAILNIDNHFTQWTESDEEIAYKIYNHIISGDNKVDVAKQAISKSIIAQHFANNLNADKTITDLRTELSISYLLNAIDHACSY